jgi:mannose-6-phosphate isomerase-like protein (cupin superfamily)
MKFKRPTLRPLRTRRAREYRSTAADGCTGGNGERASYDKGNAPTVLNLTDIARENESFRAALWTGEGLQLTVMEIPVGEDIGLENHKDTEQILIIVAGTAEVTMGKDKDTPRIREGVSHGNAIIIPKNTWHNLKNTGRVPLKLFSVYAPPNHPYGTVERHKADHPASE